MIDLVDHGPVRFEEYAKHSKLAIVPTVITPDKHGIQDSTPIIEQMEEKFPSPSIHPPVLYMRPFDCQSTQITFSATMPCTG